MKCTWVDCNQEGLIPQLDNNGNEWAKLCQEHHNEIENAISDNPFSPKRLLRAWVRAQGGSKLAASRMINGKI